MMPFPHGIDAVVELAGVVRLPNGAGGPWDRVGAVYGAGPEEAGSGPERTQSANPVLDLPAVKSIA
jgi:hypothetical protein